MVSSSLPAAACRPLLRKHARKPAASFFYSKPPRSRSFTHRASLRVIARSIARPQLPFLYPVSRTNLVQAQIGRYISTERKQRWKEQFWRQLRFHAYFWPSAILLAILAMGVRHTKIERDYPTPREWSFWTRWAFRDAKFTEFEQGAKVHRVLTDWARAGRLYVAVLERLESEKYDGKFLVKTEKQTRTDDLGVSGFDISMKSEQWRRGYHEALMGAARVAENLEGMCRRKSEAEGRIYPRESIPGPDNPRPKPLPWDKKRGHETPPTLDEVEDAFPSPESFYRRILATTGFDTRQQLDAAMAYADWCDFKGNDENAEHNYARAVEIALSGLPAGATDVADANTGIIAKGKEDLVTENILKACTAMGVSYARARDVKKALPVLLSVLRARKSLPPSPLGLIGTPKKVKQDDGLWPYVYALKDLIIERPYPAPLPSGDERPYHTLKEACEEVGLMTYIGEILFATSKSEREKGLSWTRDSVEAAEAVMWVMDEQKADDGKERCRECLETGLQNWKDMCREMARLAAKKEEEIEGGSGLFGLGLGKARKLEMAQQEKRRWEEENIQIELRRQKTLPLTQPVKPVAKRWMSTRL